MNRRLGNQFHKGRPVRNNLQLHKALREALTSKRYSISAIIRKYHVSRATLYRRLKLYRPRTLTRRENLYLMNRYTLSLIHNGGRLFTGLRTTIAGTETILHNGDVPKGTSTMDVQTILCLKRGFRYIMFKRGPLTVNLIKHINAIVGYDALFPGHFATQRMGINGIKYLPPLPSEKTAKKILVKYKSAPMTVSMQAISIMLQYDRYQFFWDGNKRTSWLVANYYLLQHGGGILDIDRHQENTWNELLRRFYETGYISKIARWLNKNCIINQI